MWEFEGKIDDVEELLILFYEVFLQIRYFLIQPMLIVLVNLESSGEFIHKLRTKEVEILMQGFLSINVDQFVLLDDEKVLRYKQLPKDLLSVIGEVVESDDDLGVLIEGRGMVDLQVTEFDSLILSEALSRTPTDTRLVHLVLLPVAGMALLGE